MDHGLTAAIESATQVSGSGFGIGIEKSRGPTGRGSVLFPSTDFMRSIASFGLFPAFAERNMLPFVTLVVAHTSSGIAPHALLFDQKGHQCQHTNVIGKDAGPPSGAPLLAKSMACGHLGAISRSLHECEEETRLGSCSNVIFCTISPWFATQSRSRNFNRRIGRSFLTWSTQSMSGSPPSTSSST